MSSDIIQIFHKAARSPSEVHLRPGLQSSSEETCSPRICTSLRHHPSLRIPLHDAPPDELPILHYFESTWIGLTVGGRRMAPAFPHVMWNVHDRYTDGASRTTNALEAFHHSFNSLISCQHPSIWTLLTSLEKQQALTTNTINEITRGTSFVHSAKERKRNERIQTLVSGYTLPQADRMLRGIAYNYM